jgi:hypothetical protein
MRQLINLVSAAALIASQLAIPALAAPGDRMAKPADGNRGGNGQGRPAPQAMPAKSAYATPKTRPAPASNEKASYGNARPGNDRAAPQNYQRPENKPTRQTPAAVDKSTRPTRPDTNNSYNRPGSNNRPGDNNYNNRPNGGNNTIVTGNTVVVPGKNGANYRYPVYQTPNGGYYRPPNGGYYGPPRPPVGGWHGGYYPPPRYYYDDGPSVGDVIAGVAVTATLLAVLSAATQPQQPQTVYVQGAPPPQLPPYVPPPKSTGAPASINVDLGAMTPEARPTASVCLTEAARQIGATGGTEIRVDRIVDVEKGNGGYRFRLNLIGVYPDETRTIPMYCRATPEKIVELTFG